MFLTLVTSEKILFQAYVISFLITWSCVFASRFVFKVYSNVWRYANSKAFISLVIADAIGGAGALVASVVPVISSFDIGGWRILSFVAMATVSTLLSRFCYQIIYQNSNKTDQMIVHLN